MEKLPLMCLFNFQICNFGGGKKKENQMQQQQQTKTKQTQQNHTKPKKDPQKPTNPNTDIDCRTRFLVFPPRISLKFQYNHQEKVLVGSMGYKDQDIRVLTLFTSALSSFRVRLQTHLKKLHQIDDSVL